jgi:hypothetical protein
MVAPVRLGTLDVSRLRSLVSATQQDHDGVALPPVVDPVAEPDVDAKLEHLAPAVFPNVGYRRYRMTALIFME